MKSIKTHITKFIAIAISALYLLMPIHKQVKNTLHSISHFLEMPNTILSHDETENLNYKFKASAITYHEHEILDLLDSLTDADTNSQDSNKPSTIDSKIDKHIQSSKYNLCKFLESKQLSVFDNYKENLKHSYYTKIKEPPKKRMQLS